MLRYPDKPPSTKLPRRWSEYATTIFTSIILRCVNSVLERMVYSPEICSRSGVLMLRVLSAKTLGLFGLVISTLSISVTVRPEDFWIIKKCDLPSK